MTKRLLAGIFWCAVILATPLAAAEHSAWLAKLEGIYIGQNSPTPFGRIGFAMDMIKQPDGSMHGHVQSDKETYFDFKFWLNEKARSSSGRREPCQVDSCSLTNWRW